MVELLETGCFLDLLLQRLYWASDVEPLNAAALGADEVIVMMTGLQQSVIRAAVMQPQPADKTQFLKLDQHPVNRGLVGTAGEIGGFGDVGEGEGLMGVDEDGKDVLQGLGAA